MKILKSILYQNFEVNLISVSPIKKARFFFKKKKISYFFWKVEVSAVTYTATAQQHTPTATTRTVVVKWQESATGTQTHATPPWWLAYKYWSKSNYLKSIFKKHFFTNQHTHLGHPAKFGILFFIYFSIYILTFFWYAFVWRNWYQIDFKILISNWLQKILEFLEFLKSIWYQFFQTNAYQKHNIWWNVASVIISGRVLVVNAKQFRYDFDQLFPVGGLYVSHLYQKFRLGINRAQPELAPYFKTESTDIPTGNNRSKSYLVNMILISLKTSNFSSNVRISR
jgi:hypothetical protein